MESRFLGLTLLTGLFQLICAIAILLGLVAIFADHNLSSDPLALVAPVVRWGVGSILFFYGLTGLVFSGGINVLISIDANTYVLKESVPDLVAALRKAQGNSVPAPIAQPAPMHAEPVHAHASDSGRACSHCGSRLEAASRFCENCGTAAVTSAS